MLVVVESTKTVAEIRRLFSEAASRHQLGVLSVHDLRQKLTEKGVPFEGECLVFEVCNPQQASAVLSKDRSISTALPCRISVFTEEGRTKIATLKPTALMGFFGKPELAQVGKSVEQSLLATIKELQ